MKSKLVNISKLVVKMEREINVNLKYLNKLKIIIRERERKLQLSILKLNINEKTTLVKLHTKIPTTISKLYLTWCKAKRNSHLAKYMELDAESERNASFMDTSENLNEIHKMDFDDH